MLTDYNSLNIVSTLGLTHSRVGRLLQTYTLIGQELKLSSLDWTKATELDLLSNQSVCS